jgi:hemerythrin
MRLLHRHLLDALRSTAQASNAEFPDRFRQLVGKLESAFLAEEACMEEMRLPALKTYREQHARILRGLHYAHAALMHGQSASGRQAVNRLLPLWLPTHFAHLDHDFAIYAPHHGRDSRRMVSGSRQLGQ